MTILRAIPFLAATAGLIACDSVVSTRLDPDAELPLVRGYRDVEDSCALVGESDFTGNFLDHTADLVACPIGSVAESTLAAGPGVRQVAATEAYALYSVPRR